MIVEQGESVPEDYIYVRRDEDNRLLATVGDVTICFDRGNREALYLCEAILTFLKKETNGD